MFKTSLMLKLVCNHCYAIFLQCLTCKTHGRYSADALAYMHKHAEARRFISQARWAQEHPDMPRGPVVGAEMLKWSSVSAGSCWLLQINENLRMDFYTIDGTHVKLNRFGARNFVNYVHSSD